MQVWTDEQVAKVHDDKGLSTTFASSWKTAALEELKTRINAHKPPLFKDSKEDVREEVWNFFFLKHLKEWNKDPTLISRAEPQDEITIPDNRRGRLCDLQFV